MSAANVKEMSRANARYKKALKHQADAGITTKKVQLTFHGLAFTAQTPSGKVQVASSLVGRINVYNILAAIGAAQALGLSTPVIEAGIRSLESVSGRFQRIDLGQSFFVVVDYAHTDDALENLIRTARELNPKGRIITLFGCGGERDKKSARRGDPGVSELTRAQPFGALHVATSA